ncbi:aspartic peptidase domain-containing protein [Podospora didyma]|uniref:Aspartic peptidase domain-containing protein n=1 Tax=Podospora didyma TaxID=330526 RepID=A0AAE0TW92_9PEZI|nr:aspartic peptidase domain-containing protein [Podospora didyma]
MAPSTLVVIAAVSGLALSAGLNAREFPGATVGRGFVSIPVSGQRRDSSNMLRKRADGFANVNINNLKTSGYTIEISVGTPPQALTVAVDTGSSELWVNPDCSKASRASNKTINGQIYITVDDTLSDPEQCRKRGEYDQSKSSSAKKATFNGQELKDNIIQYGDMTTVETAYVEDKFSIAGLQFDNQIFGVAKQSNGTGIGIMGFGPSAYGFENNVTYPLILTNMAKQKVINSPAFSLDLRDYDNSTGSLIFGGVDKKKYAGSLAKIPFKKLLTKYSTGEPFNSTSYYLTVKSMSLTLPNNSNKNIDAAPKDGFLVSLDCGAGDNVLPKGIATQICSGIGAETVPDSDNSCKIDCSYRSKPGGLKVSLEGKDIMVPWENLINEQEFASGNVCYVMVSDNMKFEAGILGAPFLRSVYAVFDWGNENLHIAQSADCGSHIVAIGSGVDAVPGGNGECSLAASTVARFGLAVGTALLTGLALL